MHEKLQSMVAAVQAQADELGHPIQARVELTVEGHPLTTLVQWVYPSASFDQWTIVDGKPVRKCAFDPELYVMGDW
jgi:hypothetical protein